MNNYLYRLIKSLFIISMMILFSGGATVAKPVVILKFFDSVTVNDTAIYVRDIAVVSTDSPELEQRVLASIAGEIAPPGYSRFINTADLLLFRLQPVFRDYDFKSLNNKRIMVKTEGVVRKVGNYTGAVERYLNEKIGWKKGEWSVVIENSEDTWKSLNLPEDVSIDGFAAATTLFPRGHIKLQLLAKQKNRIIRIPLSCVIRTTAPVGVARHEIARGKVLDLNDIELKKVDISNFAPDPYYKLEDIIGQKAIREISQGSILFNRLLTPIPVVSKGDQLEVKVTKGNVRISVLAIARETGNIGQKIWVENSATHKLVRVVLKDKTIANIL